MTLHSPRAVAALTVPVLAGLALAGCGASADSKNFAFTYAVANSGVSPYEELAKAYMQENPDVTIELNALPNDSYAETVLTQLRGGNAPDVMLTAAGSGEQNSIVPLVEADLLAPIDASARDLVAPGSEPLFEVDGDIYGVPMGITVSGLVVAGAGLQPLGVDPFPTTLKDFIAKCGDLSEMGMSFIVLAGAAPPNTGLAAMTVAASAVYADEPDWNAQREAGDVTFSDSDGWRETLDTVIALHDGGCFQEGAEGAGFDVITNNLQQQIALGAFIPGNSIGELLTSAPDANWLIEPFPTESGDPFGLVSSSYALSVPAAASNDAAAQAFVKWVAEPAQAEMFAELSNALPAVGYEDMDLSQTVYAPVANILKNGAFTTVPNATWPNSAVFDALATGVQGLLTGQVAPEQVLADMDAAWDR
ncbi:hypothetical protein ASD56_05865 [Microbacterium sp. Root166]|uniref:ABC transporter substrate-binding protein n=1 Tax=Microbacterium sp. Root166 TaxID=1736478 RepID=UPI0006FCBBF9|nr:ABC transporter substrate-binding protein [Microbacterium sp. Root166]KQZ85806.1 hypothetical protein ASD56_05865 [Microbacterium sp. Root166]